MKILLFVVAVVAVAVVGLVLRRKETVSHAPPAPATGPPNDPSAVHDLLTGYCLQERETEFFGAWQEATVGGTRVGFHGGHGRISAVLGVPDPDREQLTDIYLSMVSASNPLPAEGSGQRLEPFLDEPGKPLGKRYFLNATGASDYPQLRIPAVRDALAALSESVIELGFYEDGGMHLEWNESKATRAGIEADVRHAAAAVRALDEALVGA